MKSIKTLSLLLSVLLLATAFVACKKNEKDKTQSGDKNENQGYDEITFGDENDDESGDIVIDFDTGSVISGPSDDSSSEVGNNSTSQSETSSESSGTGNSSNDKGSDKEDDKNDTDSTTSSEKDSGEDEMKGMSPWQDSTIN